MAIDPVTGEQIPEEPTTTGGLLGVPPLELSPQEDTLSTARDNMGNITDEATTALQGVEKPTDIQYGGYDSDTLLGESGMKEGSSYVSPESTVAGQMDKLLKADSAYMQTVDKRAKEQAADLGLLGSSMAVGAAQRAAIESAMPIAQQDAKTFAEFKLNEQKTYNEMSRMKAESDLSAAAREHVYDIDVAKTKLDHTMNMIAENAKMQGQAEIELAVTKMKSQWDAETKAHLAELDASLNLKLNQQEISAREREYASTTSSSIMASAYGTVNDLMGNADFMAGYADNPEGLTQVFNNFINLAKDQVSFIGATAGLTQEYSDPDSGYLNFIGSWTA